MKEISFVVCSITVLVLFQAAHSVPAKEKQNAIETTATTEIQENRRLLEELVQNLRNAAQQAIVALQKFSEGLQEQLAEFGERVLSEIGRLRDRVFQTANEIIGRFQNASNSVTNCVETHRNDATQLFSDTVSKTMICADERINEISSHISSLSNMTSSAFDYANKVVKRLGDCTVENRNDVIAAGSCLGGVVLETQLRSASFAVQSGMTTARLNIGLAALPVTLQGCAAARLTEAAFGSARIVVEIGSCSANSLFSGFTRF